MASLYDTRRYLTNFDSILTGNLLTDVLVVGSGVAGARAAIAAAKYGSVTIVTKAEFENSATNWAQGGIAAALGSTDSPQQHRDDTLRVGCGLNDPPMVDILVREAPELIEELIRWGLGFDRAGSNLALGREGGHSTNRVLHAGGDQTGKELSRILETQVRQDPNIRVFESCFLIDILTLEGRCVGAVIYHKKYGHQLLWARQTILASGGCGQLWRETTNPPICTGDGQAAAFRAGATLANLEFMQFHPTTLYIAGATRALISEAVRGEGGHLVDRTGRRFMFDHHPDGELAPRDIVSQAIYHHLVETRSPSVFLDVRHLGGFQSRFPGIARLCAEFNIDISRELIPVRPSAHYMVGGVLARADGTTTLDGLLCCGEAACTGVHGANRLASNSLLEGLVFGRRAGETAGQTVSTTAPAASVRLMENQTPPSPRTPLDLEDIQRSLKSMMWRNVGIARTRDRLLETCDILDFWGHYTLDKTLDQTTGWELQNMLTVARMIAASALERTESIGVHSRADAEGIPASSPYHVLITRAEAGTKPVRCPLPGIQPTTQP